MGALQRMWCTALPLRRAALGKRRRRRMGRVVQNLNGVWTERVTREQKWWEIASSETRTCCGCDQTQRRVWRGVK